MCDSDTYVSTYMIYAPPCHLCTGTGLTSSGVVVNAKDE